MLFADIEVATKISGGFVNNFNLTLEEKKMVHLKHVVLILLCLVLSGASWIMDTAADPIPIIIGLDADVSSGSENAGKAIARGALIAIQEINRNGGLLGRPLALVVRDHRGNPARGIDNIIEFSMMDDLVAVLGGLHTPVAMAELEVIHAHQVVYLVPWAAGTGVVENGYTPNYVFRVSVRDEYAGGFLIGEAIGAGFRRPALLLEQTAWGRSNHRAMTRTLKERGLELAGTFWFNWGARDFSESLRLVKQSGADVVMLVGNAPEGSAAVRAMAAYPENERLPIFSHWGITGGKFYEMTEDVLQGIDLRFLQTYSFHSPVSPDRNETVFRMYKENYPETHSARDIISPVGTAHAYDLVHLLRCAVESAGTIHRPSVRDALEKIPRHRGLVKEYSPPFTPRMHDALDIGDFHLATYDETGSIVPLNSEDNDEIKMGRVVDGE